jgi:hypothetical protein
MLLVDAVRVVSERRLQLLAVRITTRLAGTVLLVHSGWRAMMGPKLRQEHAGIQQVHVEEP